jgi:hypothetical protein
LLATIRAIYEKEDRSNRFQAAIQGVDMEEQSDSTAQDVLGLKGYEAQKAGFGIGLGLGYMEE